MTRIDVRDLIGRPGMSRSVDVRESLPGLCTELAEVPEDRRVGGSFLLESVIEGILVSGPVQGSMRLVCARCLGEFQEDFTVQVRELFSKGATPEGNEYPMGEGFIDGAQMIRDAVILAMPFSPLCRPDCLGLCERCGEDRNQGACRCPAQPVDARWSVFQSLRFPEALENVDT